jgi:creatinine amidohydrolase/Fe(II)-dependent formamide hydrolase-like protein
MISLNMKLKDLSLTKLNELDEFNFLLPIGATEQHGPYIPFGTDTYITDKIIEYVESDLPQLVILPTLEYSRSDEHAGFYGTIWLKADTVKQIMKEITESLDKKAVHFFYISFHANDYLIQSFVEENQEQFKAKLTYLSCSNNQTEAEIEKLLNGPGDEHAGNTEISNMLAIDENLVDIPQSSDLKEFIDDPFETGDLAEKSKNGIADNHPKWIVNKTIGEEILKLYAKHVSKQISGYL